jgi:hypothetical protein
MHPECVPIPACLVLAVAQVLGVGPQLCARPSSAAHSRFTRGGEAVVTRRALVQRKNEPYVHTAHEPHITLALLGLCTIPLAHTGTQPEHLRLELLNLL